MSQPTCPWDLPGPAAFLARVCTSLYGRRVVSLHAPRDQGGLAVALRRRLETDGLVRVVELTLDAGDGFLRALGAAVSVDSRTPAAFVSAPELRDSVVMVVAARGCADADAQGFARLARRAASDDAPRLLWLARDAVSVLADCPAEPVRGVLHPLDGMAYVAGLPRPARALEGRLIASVAVETAGWDVALTDLLTALPIERAVRPDRCVHDWDEGRAGDWKGVVESWEDGSLDDWGGEASPHPAWLAANAPGRLAKRVWRGQIATLLPWIEQHRLTLIARFRRKLRPDEERSGPAVELLDWGPLMRQLAGVDPRLPDLLQAFRGVRNELAHARPVEWADVRLCQTNAERLR